MSCTHTAEEQRAYADACPVCLALQLARTTQAGDETRKALLGQISKLTAERDEANIRLASTLNLVEGIEKENDALRETLRMATATMHAARQQARDARRERDVEPPLPMPGLEPGAETLPK